MEIIVISAAVCSCQPKRIELDKVITNINKALQEMAIETEIIIKNDFQDSIKYGISNTPGVVINGSLRFSGRVPKVEEIIEEIERE